VLTVEVQENFTSFGVGPYSLSILSDNVVRLRFVEIDGQLCKLMVVIKMRSSEHSQDMFQYDITSTGINIGKPYTHYFGLTSGMARPSTIDCSIEPSHGAQQDDVISRTRE